MPTSLATILREKSNTAILAIEKDKKHKAEQETMDKFAKECKEMDDFITRLPDKLKSLADKGERECRVMSITGKDTRVIDKLREWVESEELTCVDRSEEEDPSRCQSRMIDALWVTW